MKRQWIIAGVVSLLLIVGGFVVAQCLWWLPQGKCSEVYRRYADSRDIAAAYIKDYKVNDTLILNATVLRALNDTGWASLRADFNIKLSHNDSTALAADLDPLGLKLGFNFGDEIKSDDDFAAFSLKDRYICVFQDIDESQREPFIDAILFKILESAKNKQTLLNN